MRSQWQKACLSNQARTTPKHTVDHHSVRLKFQPLRDRGLWPSAYLEKAFHQLATATLELSMRPDMMITRWMLLAQVSFAVESLGQENAEWNAEQAPCFWN